VDKTNTNSIPDVSR